MKNTELIELRKLFGLTQKETAPLLGVSERTLQRWESDNKADIKYNPNTLKFLFKNKDDPSLIVVPGRSSKNEMVLTAKGYIELAKMIQEAN